MKNIIIVQKRRFSMKKILSTAFAALALSMVVVSTVDAKRMVRKGRKAVPAAKAADVLNAAKDALDAKKDKDAPTMAAAARDTVAALTSPTMTAEQSELVAKRIRQADLERDIRLKKNEIADINYGWFGFGTNEDQKTNYRKAKGDLTTLTADLKVVNSRIRELEVATGKAWSNAVKFGIGALTAVGITAVAAGLDYYFNESKGMTFISEKGKAGYAKAGEVVGNARDWTSSKWNAYGPERLTGAAARKAAADAKAAQDAADAAALAAKAAQDAADAAAMQQ
jgi:hypothetical protein